MYHLKYAREEYVRPHDRQHRSRNLLSSPLSRDCTQSSRAVSSNVGMGRVVLRLTTDATRRVDTFLFISHLSQVAEK